MLVNLRSGLSIYKIESAQKYKNIGGSCIGGATFVALMKMFTDYSSIEEMINGALIGNNFDVDMSVSDIYGGDYSAFGLPGNLLASSCAKLTKNKPIQRTAIARSLVSMMIYNFSLIINLHATAEKL